MGDAPWVGLPTLGHLSWSFDATLIAPFAIASVAADKTYGDGRTWSALINNDTSISVDVNAHAVCAAK